MKKVLISIGCVIAVAAIVIGAWMAHRYHTDEEMVISLEEVEEYSDDPSTRSVHYGKYADRKLRLVRIDDTHFTFIFESDDPKVATIVFKNVDLSLFVPKQPEWITGDDDLETVFYTEREWNRQQVIFDPSSVYVDVKGGDQFEQENLTSLELIRNCLNAGLWEVMLYVEEEGKKALLYQGWFDFPLGHYQDVFDRINPVSYVSQWRRLEFWQDAAGTPVNLEVLREVQSEKQVNASYRPAEEVAAIDEQARKGKLALEEGQFATFEKPGRYNSDNPWGSEYTRFVTLEGVWLRKVRSPGSKKELDELELVFPTTRILISGIDFQTLPQLPLSEYSKGLIMPIGISLPPVYQTYPDLQDNPPDRSPYFALMLDKEGGWLNHHKIAVDGVVLFRDEKDANILHLFLLSYERHALIGHYAISLNDAE